MQTSDVVDDVCEVVDACACIVSDLEKAGIAFFRYCRGLPGPVRDFSLAAIKRNIGN